MYTSKNFKTKKAVKEALAKGEKITVYFPGMGGPPPINGPVTLEGPHFPEPHRWYGNGEVKDGRLISIK